MKLILRFISFYVKHLTFQYRIQIIYLIRSPPFEDRRHNLGQSPLSLVEEGSETSGKEHAEVLLVGEQLELTGHNRVFFTKVVELVASFLGEASADIANRVEVSQLIKVEGEHEVIVFATLGSPYAPSIGRIREREVETNFVVADENRR